MSAPQDTPERGDAGRWLVPGLWVACALALGLELLIEKHVETDVEHWFGFHGLFALGACAFLVLGARLLRRVVSRPENYYDDR